MYIQGHITRKPAEENQKLQRVWFPILKLRERQPLSSQNRFTLASCMYNTVLYYITPYIKKKIPL